MFRALFLIVLSSVAAARGADFEGWQGLRVIHQEGDPERMLSADLDADGRQEVIVVNARQSRLDVYRWLPPAERTKDVSVDAERPNELPMAPDFARSEVPLDDLPDDVLAEDIDGDDRPELLVLLPSAQKISAFKRPEKKSTSAWKEQAHWDLLPGSPVGRQHHLLLRKRDDKHRELLVSCEQGIQVIELEPGSRASWLTPRETRPRQDWALVDLDGDGDDDLVEWSSQARQSVRWYECAEGSLLPAQVLHEHAVHGFGPLRRQGRGEVLLLSAAQDGLLRRYRLADTEASDLGRQESLPMPGGTKSAWCGIRLGDEPALVAADAAQPRLRVHTLGPDGWKPEQSFPTISGVRDLAAPQAQPGTLLIGVKDASDLYRCQWKDGRLTFAEPVAADEAAKDARVLVLDTVGDTTWWVRRLAADLELYVWPKSAKTAEKTRFPAAGSKIDKVLWLGGKRLLVQQAYSPAAKLLELDGGKLKVSEPGHLAKVDLSEFNLYDVGGTLKPGRLTDGVLQWLGTDLHPTDQVMLPDGQRLVSYVAGGPRSAWVLEQGAAFIHRLQTDKTGLARVAERIRPPHGTSLRGDPVLGLLLVDQDRLVRLSRGSSSELKLVDSIDGRVGRPSGTRETTIHRFLIEPIVAAGEDDALLCDDRRHQLTLIAAQEDGLKRLLSWQVFEDQAYPYGDDKQSQVTEPRAVVGLDVDGDGRRDLAMLCQDRLLVYLAREKP